MSGCLSSVPRCTLDEPGLILVFALLLRRRGCIQARPQAGQLLIARAQRLAQALVLRSEALELTPHLQQALMLAQPFHLCASYISVEAQCPWQSTEGSHILHRALEFHTATLLHEILLT